MLCFFIGFFIMLSMTSSINSNDQGLAPFVQIIESGYLDPQDLDRLRLVSSEMYHLASSDGPWRIITRAIGLPEPAEKVRDRVRDFFLAFHDRYDTFISTNIKNITYMNVWGREIDSLENIYGNVVAELSLSEDASEDGEYLFENPNCVLGFNEAWCSARRDSMLEAPPLFLEEPWQYEYTSMDQSTILEGFFRLLDDLYQEEFSKEVREVNFSEIYTPKADRYIRDKNNQDTVSLNKNYLNRIPDVIFSKEGIEILRLCHNNIQEVPEKILEMKNLKELDLRDNPIQEVPKVPEGCKVLLGDFPPYNSDFQPAKRRKLNEEDRTVAETNTEEIDIEQFFDFDMYGSTFNHN